MGKTLGYCEFSILEEGSGRLISTGSHIKYLPMGGFYEFITSKWLLPLTIRLASATLLRPPSKTDLSRPIPSIRELYNPGDLPIQKQMRAAHLDICKCAPRIWIFVR
jgi:acyl-coenzyme A thioesterase PaaI-like protein